MTLERLEEIEAELRDPHLMVVPVLHTIATELIADNRRLRAALSFIASKAGRESRD